MQRIAHVTRPRDMDDLCTKRTHSIQHRLSVAEKARVTPQIAVERKSCKATLQFQPSDAPVNDALRHRSAMNTQERDVLSLCEHFQLAAGLGHTVQLVEGIGQERYPWAGVQAESSLSISNSPQLEIRLLSDRRSALPLLINMRTTERTPRS